MRTVIATSILAVLSLLSPSAYAGTWTEPTVITDIGAWAIWYGVTTTDQAAAAGCSGNGPKAIDITAPSSQVKTAQQAMLLAAFISGRKVKLYYDGCTKDGVSLITNVHVVN